MWLIKLSPSFWPSQPPEAALQRHQYFSWKSTYLSISIGGGAKLNWNIKMGLPHLQYMNRFTTQCQDEFRSLLQISITWCQNEAEIRGFPTMYIMRGGKYGQNWWKTWFCPNFRPKNANFSGQKFWTSDFGGINQIFEMSSSLTSSLQNVNLNSQN